MSNNALCNWVYLPISEKCVNLRRYTVLKVSGELLTDDPDGACDFELSHLEAEALRRLISRGWVSGLLHEEIADVEKEIADREVEDGE